MRQLSIKPLSLSRIPTVAIRKGTDDNSARHAQCTGRCICRTAWTRTVFCVTRHEQFQSNGSGSGCRRHCGKRCFSFVLGPRRPVFSFVLRGKSAQQQTAENPFVLDPYHRYFDTGTGHLLHIYILVATCQKRVIAESGESHHWRNRAIGIFHRRRQNLMLNRREKGSALITSGDRRM